MQQAAVLPTTRVSRAAARTPPEAFFVGSAVFHYLGPAFAVLLFALVEPLGVAWLRIVTAAVVFALWRKPWRVLHRSTEPVFGPWSRWASSWRS